MPVAIASLLWNLVGCFAYLSDAMLTPEDVATMSAAQQALYASRPAWAVAATAFAVWGGALGCIGLILRRRWAKLLLLISLAGVVVQGIALFALPEAASQAGLAVILIQGLVLVIAVALVVLGRKADSHGWLS